MYGYFGYETHRKVSGDIGKSKVKKRGIERDGIGGVDEYYCDYMDKWHPS